MRVTTREANLPLTSIAFNWDRVLIAQSSPSSGYVYIYIRGAKWGHFTSPPHRRFHSGWWGEIKASTTPKIGLLCFGLIQKKILYRQRWRVEIQSPILPSPIWPIWIWWSKGLMEVLVKFRLAHMYQWCYAFVICIVPEKPMDRPSRIDTRSSSTRNRASQ